MKKSLAALGVIVALGAVWTGSAWYTGKSVEEKAQERLALINATLPDFQSMGSEVKFDNLTIERGIFSSDITYDFIAAFPDAKVKIPFEGKIYHGPFPLDRVSKFDLIPTMLSSNAHIVQNEETQTWFDYAQGKNPFESQIKVSYDSTFTGQAKIAPVKLDLSDADILWKGIELTFDNVSDSGIGTSQMTIDGLKLEVDETEDASKAIVEVNNIKIESTLQKTEWEQIPTGKQTALIDSFRLSLVERDMRDFNLEYRNLSFDATTKKDNQFVNYELISKAPEMLVNGKSVGDLDMKIKLEHLDGKSMNELLTLVEKAEEYGPLPEEQIQALAKNILQNQPLLQIEPLKLTTDVGDLKVDMLIEMANGNFDMLEQGKALDLFKQFAVNIDLNKNALIKLFAMVEEASGVSKEEAMMSAEQTINEMFEEAIQQGAFVDSETSLNLGLVLENKALKLNGQTIPEEQILMVAVLFFLGMGY